MKLQFFGAAEEVTGSCFLLQLDNFNVLIDCGLIQGSFQDEKRNWEPFPFDVKDIDAIILTHAHLDHSGRIPLLVRSGFHGPIYCHPATKDLADILLTDSAFLFEKDAESENRRRERQHQSLIQPLYTRQDVMDCLPLFQTLKYGRKLTIAPNVKIQFNDAGHILGSSIVELWIEQKKFSKKLVFSGDLGHKGAPILHEPTYLEDANLVIMESTYGDRNHRSWNDTWNELGAALHEAEKSQGNILIPAFAIGRTQELLYTFKKHFEEWRLNQWEIFLDSPMAIEATKVYAKNWELYDNEAHTMIRQSGSPFSFPNIHLTESTVDSLGINQIRSGAIIIAGSGMCSGGRIRHHLKHNVWRRDCHIFIVGYQAKGTLGRQLVDGVDEISLWGESIKVSAKIHTIGGLSAHADQNGLLDWYGHFTTNPPVVLVHGEEKASSVLKDKLYEKYTVKAEVATYKMVIDLEII
ncbi:MAG: MBL fold metallo-hydrolase [Proteobacteria bacterium]|nr:MBL fold metallo-hydrolase [Pseudomonadota bacterium]